MPRCYDCNVCLKEKKGDYYLELCIFLCNECAEKRGIKIKKNQRRL